MSSSDGPLEKRPPHSRIGPVATRTPPSVGLSYCPALMISDTLALSTGWRRQEARAPRALIHPASLRPRASCLLHPVDSASVSDIMSAGQYDSPTLGGVLVATGPMRLWGGRFSSGPSEELMRLSASAVDEWRLAPYDLRGSRAHARELQRAGVLSAPARCSSRACAREPRRS